MSPTSPNCRVHLAHHSNKSIENFKNKQQKIDNAFPFSDIRHNYDYQTG